MCPRQIFIKTLRHFSDDLKLCHIDKAIHHTYATTLRTMSNMKGLNKLKAKVVIKNS